MKSWIYCKLHECRMPKCQHGHCEYCCERCIGEKFFDCWWQEKENN